MVDDEDSADDDEEMRDDERSAGALTPFWADEAVAADAGLEAMISSSVKLFE